MCLYYYSCFQTQYYKSVSWTTVNGLQHFDMMLSFFSPSVTDHILHAAVSSVCNAQPGGLHPLLPECSAGQLPGRLSTGETNWTSTTQGHQTNSCSHDNVLHPEIKMSAKYLSVVQICPICNKNKRQKEAKQWGSGAMPNSEWQPLWFALLVYFLTHWRLKVPHQHESYILVDIYLWNQ